MKWFTLIVVGMVFAAGSTGALAGTLTLQLMQEYSGSEAPEGAIPWLTATFDDDGSAGTVALTLDTTNLIGTEFVDEWLINLDPALDPTQLMFSTMSTTGMFIEPAINTGVNAFHAGGDGLYDVQFDFESSDDGTERFGAGDTLVVEIAGIATLTAASFDFMSTPMGSSAGPFRTVAHIQGIGIDGEGSGWTAAPEPSSMALSVMGLFAVLVWVWRSRAHCAA